MVCPVAQTAPGDWREEGEGRNKIIRQYITISNADNKLDSIIISNEDNFVAFINFYEYNYVQVNLSFVSNPQKVAISSCVRRLILWY